MLGTDGFKYLLGFDGSLASDVEELDAHLNLLRCFYPGLQHPDFDILLDARLMLTGK